MHRLRSPVSYIFALLVVAAAALLRTWLSGALSSTPFLAFYPALVMAAAFGGFGPGLLAVLVSWLCVTLFFDATPGHIGLSNPAEFQRLLVFLAGGLGVSWVSESQLRGRERLLKQAREIERDMIQLKHTEQALRHSEEDLLRTSRELERSNKDLESFAYIASHDLQEPLRTITGFLQLLEQKVGNQLDDKANQYIHYAVDGSKRMHEMITDLLSYSRVSMQSFSPKLINLRETLEHALSQTRKSIEDSDATITIKELPSVRADATQMLQVFQNLIGNAIKFRSERPLEIQVEARHDQGFWILSIKDNGIGLDLKQRDKIFKIFQRLHSRQKYPGSGIGLSICKKIIERHGGSIWVEPIPDAGSTFYFTLPSD
jgi:light-regulated signal transduction histidine kinase (bacteriophytochrome)